MTVKELIESLQAFGDTEQDRVVWISCDPGHCIAMIDAVELEADVDPHGDRWISIHHE
jgi:hypothetical protein